MFTVIRPELRLTEGTPTHSLFMCLGFPTACMVFRFHEQMMGKQRERESQVEGALLFMTSSLEVSNTPATFISFH